MEELDEKNTKVLCCEHKFCAQCLETAIKIKGFCPVCKQSACLHTDDYKDHPHDLCQTRILNNLVTSKLPELEQILDNDNISNEDLLAAFLIFNMGINYMPPTSDAKEAQVQNIKRRFSYLFQQQQQQQQHRYCLLVATSAVVACILSIFIFFVFNQGSF